MQNIKNDTPKLWVPQVIDITLIDEDPSNTNKQDRAEFEGLKNNINENGFDENCIVIPNGSRFTLVAGNHRYRAAKALGMQQILAVIRPDWDEKTASMQSVRRNVGRGSIDSKAFTDLVNELHKEHNLDFSEIQASMGFHDVDEFAALYKAEAEQKEKIDKIEEDNNPKINILDDLLAMVTHLIEEYGDTLSQSFMLVPVGGKTHLYVVSTNALKQVLQKIVIRCKETGVDLSTALTGLLHMGIKQSHFFKENNTKEFDQLEKDITIDENDTNLDIL